MTFGERLTNLRKENGYSTRKEFANFLGIPETTLRNYEKDEREPGHTFLKSISEKFNVSADYLLGLKSDKEKTDLYQLKESEYKLIKKYQSLDDYGRETVNIVIEREIERARRLRTLKESLSKSSISKRIFAYYGKIAAAGVGVDFSDMIAGTKEYYITDDNKNADYTIGVSGNSMEDTYYDGDIVFVKKQSHINVGDVGIFQKNNMIYIKEAGENGLFSYNTKYDPMIDESEVVCLGKVIGKVTDDMIIREND